MIREHNFAFDLDVDDLESSEEDKRIFTSKYINESASRILVLTARWARSIHPFHVLSDGPTLLRDCWQELFMLGLIQLSHIINLDKYLLSAVKHLSSSLSSEMDAGSFYDLERQISVIHNLMSRVQELNLNAQEFAYVKAVVLFSSDYCVDVEDRQKIQEIQSRIMNEFRDEMDPIIRGERISSLLLFLPNLRSLSSAVTEELFFSGLLDDVTIEMIIMQILKIDDNPESNPPSADVNNTTDGGGDSLATSSTEDVIYADVGPTSDDASEEAIGLE